MFYYKERHIPPQPYFNSELALRLNGIHFHDNMIVFEKLKRKEPVLQIRGTSLMAEIGKYLRPEKRSIIILIINRFHCEIKSLQELEKSLRL